MGSEGKRHKATVVGLGSMGQRHVRVLSTFADRFEFVGAYDVQVDAALPPEVRRLPSEDEAIGRADVVIVATPAAKHAATVARALAAGRHVLVEKPLCATALDAEGLVALAARGSARLFVGHSERFNPVIRTLARLVRGEPILEIDLRRVGPSRAADCGVLVNLGVHDLDLAAYLTGSPVELRAVLGGTATGAALDVAHVLFTNAKGTVGHLFVDRTAPLQARSIRITTSRWFYEGNLLSHRLARTPRRGGVRAHMPLVLEEPLAAQASALADALDGRRVHEIATGYDGACAVVLAEEAAKGATPTPSSLEETELQG